MRSIIIAGALSCALGVSGCATTGTGTVTAPTFAEVLADAQLAAETLCAVTPTAESIATIILATQGAPTQALGTVAQAAANAFCSGVVKAKARRKASRSTIPGIVDYGTIVVHGVTVDIQGVPRG